ncbi:unnamed protein product [Effrenium voratum]|nr:unnamed protein product [Effrenium voratum]
MVFQEVAKDAVAAALDEASSAAFVALGAAGGGKSYAIMGGARHFADRGLIPRTLTMLFEAKKARSDLADLEVEISFFEIYKGRASDLLTGGALQRRSAPEESVAYKLLCDGDARRKLEDRPFSPDSSSSHVVFALHLRRSGRDADLVFLDLAAELAEAASPLVSLLRCWLRGGLHEGSPYPQPTPRSRVVLLHPVRYAAGRVELLPWLQLSARLANGPLVRREAATAAATEASALRSPTGPTSTSSLSPPAEPMAVPEADASPLTWWAKLLCEARQPPAPSGHDEGRLDISHSSLSRSQKKLQATEAALPAAPHLMEEAGKPKTAVQIDVQAKEMKTPAKDAFSACVCGEVCSQRANFCQNCGLPIRRPGGAGPGPGLEMRSLSPCRATFGPMTSPVPRGRMLYLPVTPSRSPLPGMPGVPGMPGGPLPQGAPLPRGASPQRAASPLNARAASPFPGMPGVREFAARAAPAPIPMQHPKAVQFEPLTAAAPFGGAGARAPPPAQFARGTVQRTTWSPGPGPAPSPHLRPQAAGLGRATFGGPSRGLPGPAPTFAPQLAPHMSPPAQALWR